MSSTLMCDTTTDLVTRVKQSLGKLSYRQLDGVICSADERNQVTLSGKLQSYYLKQIAQTIAQKVPGVRLVRNNILVKD